MLKNKSGIVRAELLPQRDGDAYTFLVESEVGVDIRKSLFYSFAENKWPMIGLEAMGMNLEEVFISIVDQSAPKTRYERREQKGRRGKTVESAEEQFAKSILRKTEQSESDDGLSELFDTEKKS